MLKGLSLAYFKFIYYSSFYVKAMLTLPQNTMSRPLVLVVSTWKVHWLLSGVLYPQNEDITAHIWMD